MGDDFSINGPYKGKNVGAKDEYAYADITEELGRGRRYNGSRHVRGGRGYTGPRFDEPIFHQPGHHVYPQGPVITTQSIQMQPIPSRHVSFDRQPQHPPAYTQDFHGTIHPANERTCRQCDPLLLGAAVFLLICCTPIVWPAGLLAILCVYQASEHDMRGDVEGSQRARMFSAISSMCGLLVGGGLFIGGVIWLVIYYNRLRT